VLVEEAKRLLQTRPVGHEVLLAVLAQNRALVRADAPQAHPERHAQEQRQHGDASGGERDDALGRRQVVHGVRER
jgi:hypothetical protein